MALTANNKISTMIVDWLCPTIDKQISKKNSVKFSTYQQPIINFISFLKKKKKRIKII